MTPPGITHPYCNWCAVGKLAEIAVDGSSARGGDGFYTVSFAGTLSGHRARQAVSIGNQKVFKEAVPNAGVTFAIAQENERVLRWQRLSNMLTHGCLIS